MNGVKDVAALVGRIMLALMFIISGLAKLGAFEDTTGYMASAGLPAVDPLLELLLILTILIELGGGTAIVLGWKHVRPLVNFPLHGAGNACVSPLLDRAA